MTSKQVRALILVFSIEMQLLNHGEYTTCPNLSTAFDQFAMLRTVLLVRESETCLSLYISKTCLVKKLQSFARLLIK